MANFQLEWHIEGEKQVSRVLVGVKNNVSNLREPLSNSADLLKRTFQGDVFQSLGAAIGERWRPLSPVTIARKARQGMPYPSRPLHGTMKMKNSFYTVVSSDQAVIGNNAAYFKYHQSNQPRKRLPRRIMMKIDNQRKEAIVKIFHTYLFRNR